MRASRRAFLRGDTLRKATPVMRPPGADEGAFDDLCTRCEDCTKACPEGIISADAQGLPIVQLTVSACTFCGDCARACQTEALSAERIVDWPWRAQIQPACLSLNGIACRVCQDMCEQRAIRFTLLPGGKSRPVLDRDDCTGCGACAYACPADAVRFDHQPILTPEATP